LERPIDSLVGVFTNFGTVTCWTGAFEGEPPNQLANHPFFASLEDEEGSSVE